MVIAKYRQHLDLCDEIIAQQRSLLDDYDVTIPKDLDELYELYTQEQGERPDSPPTVLPEEQLNPNKVRMCTELNLYVLTLHGYPWISQCSQIEATLK